MHFLPQPELPSKRYFPKQLSENSSRTKKNLIVSNAGERR
jgi:hypothetical protein